MKMRVGHFVLAVAIALAGARAAVAQESDATIIAALLRFVDALEAGDADALEQSILAETTFHEKVRKTFVDLAIAQKRLEKSAIAKFGAEEAKRFRCGFDLIVSAADRKTIANAKVRWVEPNSASIERPGEIAPMDLRRNNKKGIWQVVLLDAVELETEDMDPFPPTPWPQPGMMRQQALANIKAKRYSDITAAFRQTQVRIDNGELATAAAAWSELIGKLTAASAEAAKARAAVPSRFKDRPPQ